MHYQHYFIIVNYAKQVVFLIISEYYRFLRLKNKFILIKMLTKHYLTVILYIDYLCIVILCIIKDGDFMKEEYISSVLKQIKSKSAKRQIAAELESHIADKIDYYIDVGYSPEDAEQKAIENMGSPDEAAVPLGSLYNIKWYKKAELWIGVILIAIHVYLMIFFPNNFKYTSVNYDILHFISIDFVSLLIFALDLCLIHLMRKRHNTLLLLPIAASLIIGLFSHALEPSLYAAAVICSKGFGGYIDSIFGYSYTSYTLNQTSYIILLSIAITVVLLVLSLYTAYTVYSEQICRNVKRAKRLLCIAEKALICFLAVNLAVMGTGTVIALVTLDNKFEENYTTRKDMIDFYINFDGNKSADEMIADFDENGYTFIPMLPRYDGICNKDNAAFVLFETNFSYNIYAVTTVSVNAVLNRDLFIDESEFDRFKRNMNDLGKTESFEPELEVTSILSLHYYENERTPEDYYDSTSMEEQSKLPPEERPYTLREFLNDKIYANAVSVSSRYPDTDGNAKIYEFRYMLKNYKHKEVMLEFFGGMLTSMTFTEYE